MQITICERHAENLAILADQREIDTPSIDTDRSNFNTLFHAGHHTRLEVFIQRKDIPIIVSAQLQNLIGETGQLFHLQLTVAQCTQNRTATGCSQVESQKRNLFH